MNVFNKTIVTTSVSIHFSFRYSGRGGWTLVSATRLNTASSGSQANFFFLTTRGYIYIENHRRVTKMIRAEKRVQSLGGKTAGNSACNFLWEGWRKTPAWPIRMQIKSQRSSGKIGNYLRTPCHPNRALVPVKEEYYKNIPCNFVLPNSWQQFGKEPNIDCEGHVFTYFWPYVMPLIRIKSLLRYHLGCLGKGDLKAGLIL